MKKIILSGLLTCSLFGANKMVLLNIQDALDSQLAKEHLLKNVSYSFNTNKGKVISKDVVANKKTNGFAKDKNLACQRAFISALRALQDAAIKHGGNKVININSYYNKNTIKSSTQYECAQGALMVGVALKGDTAK